MVTVPDAADKIVHEDDITSIYCLPPNSAYVFQARTNVPNINLCETFVWNPFPQDAQHTNLSSTCRVQLVNIIRPRQAVVDLHGQDVCVSGKQEQARRPLRSSPCSHPSLDCPSFFRRWLEHHSSQLWRAYPTSWPMKQPAQICREVQGGGLLVVTQSYCIHSWVICKYRRVISYAVRQVIDVNEETRWTKHSTLGCPRFGRWFAKRISAPQVCFGISAFDFGWGFSGLYRYFFYCVFRTKGESPRLALSYRTILLNITTKTTTTTTTIETHSRLNS